MKLEFWIGTSYSETGINGWWVTASKSDGCYPLDAGYASYVRRAL